MTVGVLMRTIASGGGQGVIGMRERAPLPCGGVEVRGKTAVGTRILARVPIEP